MFGGKFVINFQMLSTNKHNCFHSVAVAFVNSLTKGKQPCIGKLVCPFAWFE